MKTRLALLAASLLAGCGDAADAPEAPSSPSAAPAIATSAPCRREVHDDAHFTHCTADPARHRIRTALADPDGKPYRSLAALAAKRAPDAPLVAFAVNGGRFDGEGQPLGYYVENGERLHLLNRGSGEGDFYTKPNGVFYGSDGGWAVRETQAFFDEVDARPAFGTQSGPMLVSNGVLQPGLDEAGTAQQIRNAVGIDQQGRAHFVIADEKVSFAKLGRYFRDVIRAPDALALDARVSALWAPENDRLDEGAPLGPLIVVEEK